MGRKIVVRNTNIESKISYYFQTHMISIGERSSLLNKIIKLENTYTYVKSKYWLERACIGGLLNNFHVYHSSHYEIVPNPYMLIKNKATLSFPKTERELILFNDTINMYLKKETEITKEPRRRWRDKSTVKQIWKVLEEHNVISYVYHWSSNKTTRGAMFKDSWSFESDCDIKECMTGHQIANIKRRAGRHGVECISWERNRADIDIKRYRNVINGEKKLT